MSTPIKKEAQKVINQGLDFKSLPDFSNGVSNSVSNSVSTAVPTTTKPTTAPTTTTVPAGQADLSGFMGPPANAPNSPTNSNHFVKSQYALAAVKEMQQSILELSNTISSVDVSKLGQKSQPDIFGNYLSNQYMNGSQSNSNSMSNLDMIANQMKRIGTPGSFGKTDGIWGGQTDQALKNIVMLSKALLNMNSDMNLGLNNQDIKYIEEFENLVPLKYTEIKNEQKSDLASALTQKINAISSLFKQIKSKVMQDDNLKSVVEGKKSLVNITIPSSSSVTDVLNGKEYAVFNQFKDVIVPGTNLTMSDLTDIDIFKSKYMDPKQMDSKDPEKVLEALNQLTSSMPKDNNVSS